MCSVLKVSCGGYYAWLKRKPSPRTARRKMLKSEILQIFHKSKKRYGSPRITAELRMNGLKASKPLVSKLMRELEIRSIVKKKFKITTDSSHKFAVAENLLNRNFLTTEPNKVWVSDITYLRSKEGWTYLTTVIDLYDRKVIGWALSNRMHASQTTVPAFKMAKKNRLKEDEKSLIFHSDRGVQYACDEFRSELKNTKNITQSMSRKGNCWDNAVAESFFKTLKTELIYQHKYQTKKEIELAVFEYIETWYNKKRRHKHLGNLTIFEYEQLTNKNNFKKVA
jgi:transposase InsO family protein